MKRKDKDTFEIETERLKLVRILMNAFATTLTTKNKDLEAPKYKSNNLVSAATENRGFRKTRPKVGEYVLCKMYGTDTNDKTVKTGIITLKSTLGIHKKIAPVWTSL